MSQDAGDFSFLYLRNRSRLPGKVPFPPRIKRNGGQPSRKGISFFVWMWKHLADDGEDQRFSIWSFAGWILLGALFLGFIVTLSVSSLHHKIALGIRLWRCVLSLLMVFGSRVACKSLIRAILCILHMLLWSSHRILYIVYHVRYTLRWSLIAWLVVGAWEVTLGKLQTESDNQVMISIEKVLVVVALVFSTCLVKSVIANSLAAWFHVSKYDEKIVESLYYEYLLEVLSGHPTMLMSQYLPHNAILNFEDLNPVHLSSWQRRKLMIEKETGVAAGIKCESDARTEAEKIFQNVAIDNSQFIGLEDLERFLRKDDALKTLNIFRRTYETNEDIRISLLFLQEWMVHSFKRHRCLYLSLEHTDIASKRVSNIFSFIVWTLIAALLIPLLGWGPTIYTIFIITSSFVVTYFCGLTWKEHYFSMHLLFIRQPFDVGDEVEIEEVKMYVEELRLMETVFKGIDKQYQYLSNFGLYDKLLKNNSRSELPAWKMDDNEIV